MADGFTQRAAPLRHADGVYLDLPLEAYLRDDALSGSAFKKLLSGCPADLTWESEANPLWIKPAPSANRALLRGSASHCAILEGLDAYRQRYAVKPDGVLSSTVDLKRFLSEERARRKEASIGGRLSREDAAAVRQTGDREELVARIHAIDPDVPIWEPDEDTKTLTAQDDAYVRLVEAFVRVDPVFGALVSGGLAEVSIFWTDEHGQRFKARPDYLRPGTLLDLKTFGRPPGRGAELRSYCVAQAGFNGYDLQAVHNMRAVREAAKRYAVLDSFAIHGVGPRVTERAALLEEIFRSADTLVFRWLFLRMGGAPTGISIPFRESDGQWQEAERQIEDAVAIAREFGQRFKPGELWLATHGEKEIQDMDWPLAATWPTRRLSDDIDGDFE